MYIHITLTIQHCIRVKRENTNNKIPRFSDKIDHFFLTYDLVKFRVTKIFHLN